MRRAAWLCLFLLTFAFDALAQQPIAPRPRIPSHNVFVLARYEWLTPAGNEVIEAQVPLSRRGRFVGVMNGDPVRGAIVMDDGAERMLVVRSRNGAPWMAYVGARGGAYGPRFSGVAYALAPSANATAARNSWSIMAAPVRPQGCFRGRPCPGLTRPPDPPSATRPYPKGLLNKETGIPGTLDSPIAHEIESNVETGALETTIAANGGLTGLVFNDAISGHYADTAGTLSFVRMQGGQAEQLFVATLEHGSRMSGRVYSLSGTFEQTWQGRHAPLVFALQSASSTECMQPQQSPNDRISLVECANPVDPTQQWVLIHVGSWRLSSMTTGLCAALGNNGAFVVQRDCGRASPQVIRVDGAFSDTSGNWRIMEGLGPASGAQPTGFPQLRFRTPLDRLCIGVPSQGAADYVAITRPCEEDYEEKVWWGKRT